MVPAGMDLIQGSDFQKGSIWLLESPHKILLNSVSLIGYYTQNILGGGGRGIDPINCTPSDKKEN